MAGLPIDATAATFAGGNRPVGALSWPQSLVLGTTNHRTSSAQSGGVAVSGQSWTEEFLRLRQWSDWDNVAAVRATQHGSALLRNVGWGAAIASYLVGGGLLAMELQSLKDGEAVDSARLGVAGAALLAGVAFLKVALANRDRQVTIYSLHPEQHEDFVRIDH